MTPETSTPPDVYTHAQHLLTTNPGRRFAVSASGNTIAVHDPAVGWHPVLSRAISGDLVTLPDYGLPLLNGKPAVTEWEEVK